MDISEEIDINIKEILRRCLETGINPIEVLSDAIIKKSRMDNYIKAALNDEDELNY